MAVTSIHKRRAPARRKREADMTGEEPCEKCGEALNDHAMASWNGEESVVCSTAKMLFLRLLREHEYVREAETDGR